MKNIFVLQCHSFADLITNSSSEIYINKDISLETTDAISRKFNIRLHKCNLDINKVPKDKYDEFINNSSHSRFRNYEDKILKKYSIDSIYAAIPDELREKIYEEKMNFFHEDSVKQHEIYNIMSDKSISYAEFCNLHDESHWGGDLQGYFNYRLFTSACSYGFLDMLTTQTIFTDEFESYSIDALEKLDCLGFTRFHLG